MNLHIYNWNILRESFPKLSYTKELITDLLIRCFKEFKLKDINIVFVSSKDIKELNKEYREVDSITDVLSFQLEENPVKGEIYICPEYIVQQYDQYEIIRDIVHGILHLSGYDHISEFKPEDKDKEDMFVKQEDILQNITYEINSRIRKS